MNAKVNTIAKHKGVVGKATSTDSIGAGLAIIGKRVLLIDLDTQTASPLSAPKTISFY